MDESSDHFLSLLGRLKHLPRKGWTYYPIPEVETVACHMYRMALSAFLLPHDQVDVYRVMRICLVHDIGESIIGDITPRDQVAPQTKREQEDSAVRQIASLLPSTWAQEELYSLFREYETGTSAEAVLARDLDKYDMVLQALEYEHTHTIDLSSFFDSTRDLFQTDLIKAWAQRLYARRSDIKTQSS